MVQRGQELHFGNGADQNRLDPTTTAGNGQRLQDGRIGTARNGDRHGGTARVGQGEQVIEVIERHKERQAASERKKKLRAGPLRLAFLQKSPDAFLSVAPQSVVGHPRRGAFVGGRFVQRQLIVEGGLANAQR